MRAIFHAAVFVLASLALLPQPASAYITKAVYRNESTNCVWLTLYSGDGQTWSIVGDPARRPRYVAPRHSFAVGGPWKFLRVRSEVMPGAECTGHWIDNVVKSYSGVEAYRDYEPIPTLVGNVKDRFRYVGY